MAYFQLQVILSWKFNTLTLLNYGITVCANDHIILCSHNFSHFVENFSTIRTVRALVDVPIYIH